MRGITKWVESLIDSQINLICALLETTPQGCSGAVTRALIGISGVTLAERTFSGRADRAGRRREAPRAHSVARAAGGVAAAGPPEIR